MIFPNLPNLQISQSVIVTLIFLLCFIPATRETAFLHAISSAAITHELTLQCRLNRIPGCKCGKTRKQPKAKSGWQWGGCSDDIKFGEKETKRFTDKLERGNDARTAFNLHNNGVGRKVTATVFCSPVSTKKLLRIFPLLQKQFILPSSPVMAAN